MKAVVIVDGLNLHHALQNFGPGHTRPDLVSICRQLAKRNTTVIELFYFSAPPHHLGPRHLFEYVEFRQRLQNSGVQIIESRFQKSNWTCNLCRQVSVVHKEKETDVAIAVRICEAALDGLVSQIFLFSADSDLTPALVFAKRVNPNIEITIVQTSMFLRNAAYSLISKADGKIRLRPELVHKYQFNG